MAAVATKRICALCEAHEAYSPVTSPDAATACELCSARVVGPIGGYGRPAADVDACVECIELAYLAACAEAADLSVDKGAT